MTMPDATIRPFEVNVPEEDLVDLQRRLAATRQPSTELVGDRSQGVQLGTMQELTRYWRTGYDWLKCEPPPQVSVPVGFTTFPGEIFRAPRSWVEKAYPSLTYFHEADRGGHFAAWEEPELFAAEIRAAFKPLR